jgi:hypothetical protein
METKKFAISFLPMPDYDQSKMQVEFIVDAEVVLYTEEKEAPDIYSPSKSIAIKNKRNNLEDIFKNRDAIYDSFRFESRKSWERVVSDIICGIILEKSREYKNDCELVFFIGGQFKTEKIFGRLGYLCLPIDRITIFIISRNLADFYTRNLISPLDTDRIDFNYLQKESHQNDIFGPFPDDNTISLSRTFYRTYSVNIFPLKIDLFSQSLDRSGISTIKKSIKEEYFSPANTDLIDVYGFKPIGKTRLPKLLVKSEIYVNEKRKKYE